MSCGQVTGREGGVLPIQLSHTTSLFTIYLELVYHLIHHNHPARARARKACALRELGPPRCPHGGLGEDFLPRRMVPLTKTTVTRKQKVAKLIRRCQKARNAEGYKSPIGVP